METISLAISSVADLMVRYKPWPTNPAGFAFLVHPRNIPDIYRKYPLLRYLPKSFIKFMLAHFFWPVTVSEITGHIKLNKRYKDIKGWVISIPITAEQMLNDRTLALKFIIKASKLAEKKGATMIGLGALTASLTRGGLDILPHVNVGITTGRIYTSKIILDTVEAVLGKLDIRRDNIKVAVVGAAGSIGTGCAHILVKRGFKDLLLVDLPRKQEKLEILSQKLKVLNSDVSVQKEDKIESIKLADVVIVATNHPDAIIQSEHLKAGALVIDDAQPSNVNPDIIFDRDDVIILEGGVVHAPGIDPHFNFGLKHKEDIFSCLAETIILYVNGYNGSFQVGEIFDFDDDMLRVMDKHSKRLGFRIGEFQNFHKVYSAKDFEYVRNLLSEKNV